MMRLAIFLIFLSTFFYIPNKTQADLQPHETEDFKSYWYDGKAEITSYKLNQARYGTIHEGYAVLIFVTEDLSKIKQVKLDDPYSNQDDAVKVLKLNLVKKFNTGIYKYSIMESIFTPVDLDNYPNRLKLSLSSQEWCGHVFTQLNLNKNKYRVNQFSYFESDGDISFDIKKAILEDEIWTRIRLNPQSLPVGNIRIIPSLIISRLNHNKIEIVNAKATLTDFRNPELMLYKLELKDTERELNIYFNKSFPHEIISWIEKYKSGFGDNSRIFITRAEKNKSLFIDYWNKNSTIDMRLRKQLGIE